MIKKFLPLDVVKRRSLTLGWVLILALITLSTGFYNGLRYGIDFQGGLCLEIDMPEAPDLKKLRTALTRNIHVGFMLQEFGDPKRLLIRCESPRSDAVVDSSLVKKITKSLDPRAVIRRSVMIGPKSGSELFYKGCFAITWSLVAMLIYIALRFRLSFALSSIIALFHDCLCVISLYTVFRLEWSEMSFVALLITASYSINDTVIIFDRIRENQRKDPTAPLISLINPSVNETLSRTLLTSATTLVALAMLYLFGGHVISSFSLPIFVGIACGTISSIFLAPVLLTYVKPEQGSQA